MLADWRLSSLVFHFLFARWSQDDNGCYVSSGLNLLSLLSISLAENENRLHEPIRLAKHADGSCKMVTTIILLRQLFGRLSCAKWLNECRLSNKFGSYYEMKEQGESFILVADTDVVFLNAFLATLNFWVMRRGSLFVGAPAGGCCCCCYPASVCTSKTNFLD